MVVDGSSGCKRGVVVGCYWLSFFLTISIIFMKCMKANSILNQKEKVKSFIDYGKK